MQNDHKDMQTDMKQLHVQYTTSITYNPFVWMSYSYAGEVQGFLPVSGGPLFHNLSTATGIVENI